VSPRTYFVFTPLLNDTATGTLEFRNTLEPIRNKRFKGEYLQGWADDVNFATKTVTIEPSVLDPDVGHGLTGERQGNQTLVSSTGGQRVPTFEISYDKLAICVGCYSQTFGTKGVREVSYLYFVYSMTMIADFRPSIRDMSFMEYWKPFSPGFNFCHSIVCISPQI
jgi:NADH dehydrogenase FAD-containing subunit